MNHDSLVDDDERAGARGHSAAAGRHSFASAEMNKLDGINVGTDAGLLSGVSVSERGRLEDKFFIPVSNPVNHGITAANRIFDQFTARGAQILQIPRLELTRNGSKRCKYSKTHASRAFMPIVEKTLHDTIKRELD